MNTLCLLNLPTTIAFKLAQDLLPSTLTMDVIHTLLCPCLLTIIAPQRVIPTLLQMTLLGVSKQTFPVPKTLYIERNNASKGMQTNTAGMQNSP